MPKISEIFFAAEVFAAANGLSIAHVKLSDQHHNELADEILTNLDGVATKSLKLNSLNGVLIEGQLPSFSPEFRFVALPTPQNPEP